MLEAIKTVEILIVAGFIDGFITHEVLLKIEVFDIKKECMSSFWQLGARNTSIQVMFRV